MEHLDLMRLFKGFIRNYGTLLLGDDKITTYTQREVGFWMTLGEMMGYFTQQEQQMIIKGKPRKADLLWLADDYETPVLHLESENYMQGTKLIANRLDPAIPYLVALFRRQGEENKALFRAALKFMKRSDRIKQLLLIVWGGGHLSEGPDISVVGARFTRRKDYPDIVEGRLRHVEHHKAGLYFGILEEDWEDLWTCDFCHGSFLSKQEAEKHEETCAERTE